MNFLYWKKKRKRQVFDKFNIMNCDSEIGNDEQCKMYVWGANGSGQLGLGHNRENEANKPILIKYLRQLQDVKAISGGGSHTIVLRGDGSLLICGNNCKYQLGIPDVESINTFQPLSINLKITKILCGWEHTVAITDSGEIYSWGGNNYRQLGSDCKVKRTCIPQKINVIKNGVNRKIIDGSTGLRHTIVLTEENEVFSWGSNKYGQLGINDHDESVPQEIVSLCGLQIKQIVAGAFCSAALSGDNEIFLWGHNNRGQLSVDPEKLQKTTLPIKKTLPSKKIKFIRAGWSHFMAVTDDGAVLSWGRNDYGQLGRKTDKGFDWEAKEVPGLKWPKILCAGAEHNVAVVEKVDGSDEIYTWGWNEHGICGNGNEVNVTSPSRLELNPSVKVYQVGVGCGQNVIIVERV